jgi:hypothetical protein
LLSPLPMLHCSSAAGDAVSARKEPMQIDLKASVDADLLKLDWDSKRWFGAKLGQFTVRLWQETDANSLPSRISGCLAQAHARDIENEGLACGAGIGQVGQRHLLYVGARNGQPHLSVGFCWLTRGKP